MKTVHLLRSLTLALALILGVALTTFVVQSLAASRAENVSSASPSAPSAPSDWQLESVEIGAYSEAGTALALAPGTLHPRIAYGDEPAGTRVLKYASYNGSNWQTETVSGTDGMGGHLSLALDNAGNPHISYYSDNKLMHAWHDGATWHVETVDSQGSAGWFSSIAMDSLDRPHISYFDESNDDLRYARYNGVAWQTETVDSAGNVGRFTSLGLDGLDRPHISYYDYDNDTLKYARYDGATWHVETVDNTGVVGFYTSLELDAAGQPLISYTGGGLKYARYDGASWHIEMVEAGDYIGWYSSLALDGLGLPHISYCDLEGELKYAWFDSQTWHIETVDSAGYAGWNTSMEVDEQGRARISYYELGAQELKHARRLHVHLFLNKQASPRSNVHNNETVTYTLTMFGPGLDLRLSDPLPDTVNYVTDSITYTVPPAAVYSPTIHAITWQGTMPTDTIQQVRFQVTVDIPGAEPSALAPTIFNTAVLTDTGRGVSTSATAVVNRFVYLPMIVRSN